MKKSIFTTIALTLLSVFNLSSQSITLEEAVNIASEENRSLAYIPSPDGQKAPVFLFKNFNQSNKGGNTTIKLNQAKIIGDFGSQRPGPVFQSWSGFASNVVSHGGGPGETTSYFVTCVPDEMFCLIILLL